jgi:signal transduction histidine kinase
VRIAREAIVNAARHGEAHHIDVFLKQRGPRWLLTVSDDGCGIEDSAFTTTTGFGLRFMKRRAEEVGGQLSARRRDSGGTVLELSLAAPPRGPGLAPDTSPERYASDNA